MKFKYVIYDQMENGKIAYIYILTKNSLFALKLFSFYKCMYMTAWLSKFTSHGGKTANFRMVCEELTHRPHKTVMTENTIIEKRIIVFNF